MDDATLPETKALAKVASAKFYFTGSLCLHGHRSKRRTSTGQCVECERRINREMHAAHKESLNARHRADYKKARPHRIARALRWSAENPERAREITKASRVRNLAKNNERSRIKRARNPEKEREYVRRWIRANRHRVSELVKRRKLAKIRACPPWLTKEHKAEIAELYRRAQALTMQTGTPHHVDHFYPLRGKNFCGLHVPWNLRVTTGLENLKKGSRAPEGEPVW